MFVLLSDGAGLAARQTATVLSRAGHRVEALSPAGLCLTRMTRHVRRVHDVPPIGRCPFGWLDAALGIAVGRGADVLLPVQEQVTVMSLARERIEAAGLATAVPDFGALVQVQDKVSAYRMLARIGVPQPPAVVATSAAELADTAGLGWPVFVKTPIGTASAGVRRAGSREELRRIAAEYERQGVFGGADGADSADSAGHEGDGDGAGHGSGVDGAGHQGGADGAGSRDNAGTGGVLVQQAVAGRLAMVQAVFARGELVAFHACEQVREGTGGGSSHKLGRRLPEAREQMARLGAALGWHGALSADVIVEADGSGPDGSGLGESGLGGSGLGGSGLDGVRFIDINPRLVEPVNALASGVDLVRALVEVACSGSSRPQPDGRAGVRTHQLLLAVLRTAQRGSRRDVARELGTALLRRGGYRGSREELTPLAGDVLAPLPVAVIGLATLISPATWQYFTGGSVGAYSLSPAAWEELRRAHAKRDGDPGHEEAQGRVVRNADRG